MLPPRDESGALWAVLGFIAIAVMVLVLGDDFDPPADATMQPAQCECAQ